MVWWPRLVAAGVVLVVLAPAAGASYLHARHVVQRHDETMANWLPLTTDGMLLAALVVMWARRATRGPAGRWVWLTFALGLVATLAANVAAVLPAPSPHFPSWWGSAQFTLEALAIAIWPPITVAITLELAALLVMPASRVLNTKARSVTSKGPDAQESATQLAAPPALAPAETGPTSAAPLSDDTPTSSLADPDAALYAQVLELARDRIGRPTIMEKLDIPEGRARALLDRAKKELAATSNGNGQVH